MLFKGLYVKKIFFANKRARNMVSKSNILYNRT